MSDFDKNKLRRLDLTVLLVFMGLMKHRKAAAVARDMGLTNSSISHALNRLRDVFDDALFLRRPHGLEPTAFALSIESDLRDALEAVQSALAGPPEFEPASAESTIRIAARDRSVASLMPNLMSELAQHAPGMRVAVASMSARESLQALRDGDIDFSIGFIANPGPDFERELLRRETYLVAARRGHDLFSGELTPQKYAAATHILVSGDGSLSGIVDDTLAQQGLTRRVCAAVPQFLAALSILRNSDFVATLPAAAVTQYADLFGLDYCEPPIAIRSFDVSLVSHIRNHRDPRLNWFRDVLLSVSGMKLQSGAH